MLRLERIGQRAALSAGAVILVALGFGLHSLIPTPSNACGRNPDVPCWHVQTSYAEIISIKLEREIARLRAAGFSEKEIEDYTQRVANAPSLMWP